MRTRSLCTYLVGVILLLGPRCLVAQTNPDDHASPMPDIQRRLDRLEGFQEAVQAGLDAKITVQNAHIDEVRREVEAGNSTATWEIFGTGFALLIVILGGAYTVYQTAVRKIQDRLEPRIEKEVEANLKTQFDQSLEKRVIPLVEGQKKDFEGMLAHYSFTREVKQSKRLLVLCENDEECTRLENVLLYDLGFKHVEPMVMAPNIDVSGFDMTIFAREDDVREKEGFYERLSVEAIKTFIDKGPNRKRNFVVYIPNGDDGKKLNTHKDRLIFANTQVTLGYRILEYFLLHGSTKTS